jgi:hypothetical protein
LAVSRVRTDNEVTSQKSCNHDTSCAGGRGHLLNADRPKMRPPDVAYQTDSPRSQ